MTTDTRYLGSRGTGEAYITASAGPETCLEKQGERIFAEIGEVLRSTGSWIMEERIFAAAGAMDALRRVRAEMYGDLDDGVGPNCLLVPPGTYGDFAGVQVHGVFSPDSPNVLRLNDLPCGRILRHREFSYITLSGISAPHAGPPPVQAREMLREAEWALRQVGAGMRSVARTWMWLTGILSWYADFNRVRNQFFTEQGILDEAEHSLPASTGIGIGPANGASCAMDLVAVLGPAGSIQYLLESGHQRSPCYYGSAFSRALRAKTPAGETVYVSGTAAIDADGATQHAGDIPAQIDVTLAHVRAVLRDMDCQDKDVVQALAYCKTPEVEQRFLARRGDIPWPILTMIGDICRSDLLFEIEVTAMPGAKKL